MLKVMEKGMVEALFVLQKSSTLTFFYHFHRVVLKSFMRKLSEPGVGVGLGEDGDGDCDEVAAGSVFHEEECYCYFFFPFYFCKI